MSQSFKDHQEVTIDVHTFVDPTQTFTVVSIFAGKDEQIVEGLGVAKRNPEDEYDFNEGVNLALKRAFLDLAQQFSEY